MREEASQPMLTATNQGVWWGLVLGAAFAGGCATGVDVTDEELAAICSDPNNRCNNAVAGASGGSGGGITGGGFGGGGSGNSFSPNGGTGAQPSNGGSPAANGGTGGSIGSSGSGGSGAMLPLAEGDCLDTDDIVVLYRDRTTGAASTQEPSMEMQVQNPGGTSFPLSDLAIRYWFTADGRSNFIATVDYASINGQSNINNGIVITFNQEFGSDYAEMTFPTLTDSIGAEGIDQLQLRFHSDPYGPLNQTNDFSFLSGASTLTPNRNVTPYLRSSQAGGCVPIPP